MPYGTFTFTGTLVELDGVTPHVGSISIVPNATIRDAAGDLVLAGPHRVALDETGHFTVDLPADDPTLNPSSGIGYEIRYHLSKVAFPVTRLAAQAAGTVLDYSSVIDESTPTPITTIVGAPGPQGAQGAQGLTGAVGPTGPAGGGVRWVALGDSLTSLAGGGAPYMGWVTQSEILSAGRLSVLSNAGVSGDNAADALARVPSIVAAAPTLVTVWLGVNDISQGRTLAAYQADINAIVDALEAAGATIVILTIPPRSDTSKLAQINAWNGWLKALARDRTLHLVDAHDAVVHRTTGVYGAGYNSGDGIHMTQLGHNKVAARFTSIMLPRVVSSEPLAPTTNADPNNLLANGLLLSGAGASPDSWIPTGGPTTGFTETWVNDSDFRGGKAWEVAAVTPGSFREFLQNASAAWSVGDELLFTCRVKVVSSSGVPAGSGLNINCNMFGSSGINPAAQGISLPGLNGLVSARLVVPPGTTTVQLDAVTNPTSAGTATYRVGEFGIYNLTALGLS